MFRFTSSRRVLIFILVLISFVRVAEAGGPLRETITNLFGADGIILEDVILKKAPPDNLSRAGDFAASSLSGLEHLNDQITSTFGVFSFNSSVIGFSFDFDRGIPVRTTESFGPLLTERAPTLGARRLDVGLTYTRIDFTRFQGSDLGNIQLAFQSEDINQNGAIETKGPFKAESDQVRMRLNLDVSEDIFAIAATYGLTGYWDVGAVVPLVHLRFFARGEAVIVDKDGNLGGTIVGGEPVHVFRNGTSSITASDGGDATGLGDIILRTKYHFFKSDSVFPDLAAVVEVKLPTGNSDDLLGTGGTNVTTLLVGSKTYGRWFTPHINLGYVADTRDSHQSKIRYAVGFDARVSEKLTVVGDLIGFSRPDGNGVGDNTVDLSLGARWHPIGSWFLSANFQIPLNKASGLRADVIPTFAIEYIF